MNEQNTLQEVKDIAIKHARKYGDVIPSLFVKIADSNEITVVPIMSFPKKRKDKHALFEKLGRKIARKNFEVESIVLSAEFERRKQQQEEVLSERVFVLILDMPQQNRHKLIKSMDIDRGQPQLEFKNERPINEGNCGFMDFKILDSFWTGYYS